MNSQMKDTIFPLLFTLIILVILEIFSTSLLPLFGTCEVPHSFNILVVLFLGFKVESPYIAILILVTQYFHSFFSIEGWEMGTIAGIVICVTISYLKDLIHFTSSAITILVTQIFQLVWFSIVAGLTFMKLGEFTYVIDKFWRFIPESLIISFLAPFFFAIFDRIWRVESEGMLGNEG